MKEFRSLSELIAYTKKCSREALEDVGEEAMDIMRDETQRQVYDAYNPSSYQRTGEILNCINVTEVRDDMVKIEWQDLGGWSSYNGNPFYAPIGLESGKTYGRDGYRPKTDLEKVSRDRLEEKAPVEYKETMRRKGFTVK